MITFNDEEFKKCFKDSNLDIQILKVEGNNGIQMGFCFLGEILCGSLISFLEMTNSIEKAIKEYNKDLEDQNKTFIDFIKISDSKVIFALGFDKFNLDSGHEGKRIL